MFLPFLFLGEMHRSEWSGMKYPLKIFYSIYFLLKGLLELVGIDPLQPHFLMVEVVSYFPLYSWSKFAIIVACVEWSVAGLSYIFRVCNVYLTDLVFLSRIDGKPEDVLNPKKKQLEKITPVCICFASSFLCSSLKWISLCYPDYSIAFHIINLIHRRKTV